MASSSCQAGHSQGADEERRSANPAASQDGLAHTDSAVAKAAVDKHTAGAAVSESGVPNSPPAPSASTFEATADCAWIPTANVYGFHIDVVAQPELLWVREVTKLAERAREGGGGGGITVADLGCGLGYTTETLLRACRMGGLHADITPQTTVRPSVNWGPLSEGGGGDAVAPLEVTALAADLDRHHVDALTARLRPEDAARVRTMVGDCTALPLEPGSLSGVLACRWLHFLDGDALRRFITRATDWLAPGGVLCFTVETPFLGTTVDTFLPVYLRRCAAGEEWPGIRVLPPEYPHASQLPPFLHLLDPTILAREAVRAGLEVMACDFVPRPYYPVKLHLDGRESAFILARKPHK